MRLMQCNATARSCQTAAEGINMHACVFSSLLTITEAADVFRCAGFHVAVFNKPLRLLIYATL